eukprot:scaffold21994_cov71-Phaeocystis_antarctica.AAC.4
MPSEVLCQLGASGGRGVNEAIADYTDILYHAACHSTNTAARELSAPCLATQRADGYTRCPPRTACPGWVRGRPYRRARRSWGSGALPPCPRRCRWARSAARRASCCCLASRVYASHTVIAHDVMRDALWLLSYCGYTSVEEELGRGVPSGARDLVERGRHGERA